MSPPVTHAEDEESYVNCLNREEQGQLGRVAPQQTVKGPKDQHPNRVCEGVCQEAVQLGLPVVQEVLGQATTQPVGQEATHHGDPDYHEVEQVVQHIQELVAGVEAEAEGGLREEEEAEVLEVSVEEERSEVDSHGEGSQQF